MKQREIGTSGIFASEMSMGAWAIGGGTWWGDNDDAESIRTIHAALDLSLIHILFPIFYAIILGVLSGPQVLKIVDNRHVKAASKLVVVGICPFIAKLGITAGANIDTILNSGPALLLHGFGNLLGPLLAMPIAILLGMKREAVGACHSINREYHMALINNIYGPESAEARGSLSIYIVGGMRCV